VDDFNIRKEEHMKRYGRSPQPTSTSRGETSIAAETAADTSAPAASAPTRSTDSSAAAEALQARFDKMQHDEGDEVVEADEDMVIY
jgi:hypothetical protein